MLLARTGSQGGPRSLQNAKSARSEDVAVFTGARGCRSSATEWVRSMLYVVLSRAGPDRHASFLDAGSAARRLSEDVIATQ